MRVPAFSPALLPALPVGLFTRGQLPASLLPCLCSCPFLPKHDGHTSAGCRGCSLQDPRGKCPAYRSGVLDLNSGFMSSRLPACRGTPPLPCSAAASWRRGSDPAPRGCSGEAQNPYLVQEAARIQSGPRGTLLFPTAFLPQPRGPRGPWGMGAEAASFPRPEEGQRLWAGPVVCTACESLLPSPWLRARGSGRARGQGPRQAVRGIPALAPHRPLQVHAPTVLQTPGSPGLSLLSDPPGSQATPDPLHGVFLGSSSASLLYLLSLPLQATPRLRSEWSPTISSPTPFGSPGISPLYII